MAIYDAKTPWQSLLFNDGRSVNLPHRPIADRATYFPRDQTQLVGAWIGQWKAMLLVSIWRQGAASQKGDRNNYRAALFSSFITIFEGCCKRDRTQLKGLLKVETAREQLKTSLPEVLL